MRKWIAKKFWIALDGRIKEIPEVSRKILSFITGDEWFNAYWKATFDYSTPVKYSDIFRVGDEWFVYKTQYYHKCPMFFAQDLIEVAPMTAPTGEVFYLNYVDK